MLKSHKCNFNENMKSECIIDKISEISCYNASYNLIDKMSNNIEKMQGLGRHVDFKKAIKHA